METTAQIAFKQFQDNQLKTEYVWDSMTSEQRQLEMNEYTRLKIAAAKEVEANRIESEQQQTIEQESRKQAMIDYLISEGFVCDNSLSDWEKLYNKPLLFGSNWMSVASTKYSESTGIEYFINIAFPLWNEIKNIN